MRRLRQSTGFAIVAAHTAPALAARLRSAAANAARASAIGVFDHAANAVPDGFSGIDHIYAAPRPSHHQTVMFDLPLQ